jgi:hypothetical protein
MLQKPKALILVGFVLVLLGFVVPVLIVLDILPNTFLLNFLAYGASISGLLLGFIGTTMAVKIRRDGSLQEDFYSAQPPRKPGLFGFLGALPQREKHSDRKGTSGES